MLAAGDERGFASLSWYDPAGQVRSLSGVRQDGTPVLELYDGAGQPRLSASVDGETAMIVAGARDAAQGYFGTIGGSPLVTLTDGTRNRLQLFLNASGRPRALLADAAGRESIGLGVGGSDMPELRVSAEGRLRGLLTVAQDAALISLRDAERRQRLVLGVAENGRPSVNFFDEDGELVAEVPSRR